MQVCGCCVRDGDGEVIGAAQRVQQGACAAADAACVWIMSRSIAACWVGTEYDEQHFTTRAYLLLRGAEDALAEQRQACALRVGFDQLVANCLIHVAIQLINFLMFR